LADDKGGPGVGVETFLTKFSDSTGGNSGGDTAAVSYFLLYCT